jgi:large subunit ribosomal protein L25
MDKIVLSASARNRIGKKVKFLRREGKLPAILYGKSMDNPIPVTMDNAETSKIMRQISSSTLVTIDVDGEEHMTLVRDFQVDPIYGTLQHVDFLVVSMSEKVSTMITVQVEGVAPIIEAEGGLLVTGMEQIEIQALPQDLPGHLSIDVSGLKAFGDTLYVRDVHLPAGVELLTDPDELLIVATAPQDEVIEVEVDEDAELLEGEERPEGEEGEAEEAADDDEVEE